MEDGAKYSPAHIFNDGITTTFTLLKIKNEMPKLEIGDGIAIRGFTYVVLNVDEAFIKVSNTTGLVRSFTKDEIKQIWRDNILIYDRN